MINVTSVITLLSISGITAPHMEMSSPYPLRSKFNSTNNPAVDYSMPNPLDPDGE
jgi:hypothetical protein